MTSKNSRLASIVLAGTVATGAMLAPVAASADVTGNIGVFSKYVLRGITNNAENDNTAVQGGFDYAHASGIYAGYWGSNLDYGNSDTNSGFENDFYAGYAGSAGPLTYSAGVIQYYYMEVEDSDGTEFNGTLGYGPVTLGLKYLLTDVAWGNTGDMYWTLGYSTKLPKDFTVGATLGYYVYEDDDNNDMCAAAALASGCSITTEDSAFRHLDLTLAHPIGNTGADMSLTYTMGGDDRTGTDQKDALVFGVKYGFKL